MLRRFLTLAAVAALAVPVSLAQPRPRATPAPRTQPPPAATARPTPRTDGPAMSPSGVVPNASTLKLMPVALPTPNDQRAADGRPGSAYWQQRTDYRIRASLSPATHRIAGSVTMRYTNNAPQPLAYVWVALEQNLFSPGSIGATLQPGGTRWSGSFPGGGYTISRVEVVQNGQRYTPTQTLDDTRMRLDLRTPLAATGGTVEIEVDFAFVVPEQGSDRLGRYEAARGTVYEVAQWYPKLYVYDDVNGWNPLPYAGQGEFYLGYGNFDVEITAPNDMIVVGGGELLNPGEVYTPEQARRATRAATSEETVTIVGADEVGTPASRPRGTNGVLTWKYKLENARDFAWAASKAFILDAASWDGTLLMSAYPHEGVGTPGQATEGWEKSTQYLRHTIRFYSDTWFRYPYPVAINVAGTVGGMEYPAIVFCGVRARGPGLFGVTDHEFGHTWFPMVVGSDERRHIWMDEGFNTFINRYSNLAYYGDDAARAGRTGADAIAAGMTSALADQPIMTPTDAIRRHGPRLPRLLQTGRGPRAAARVRPRAGALRRRLPRVHPPLGLQAPAARRLLPHHRRRLGRGPRLLLARLVHDDRHVRPGHHERLDGQRRHLRHHREQGRPAAPDDGRGHLRRRPHRAPPRAGARLLDRPDVHRLVLRRRDRRPHRPRRLAPGHRPRERHVADVALMRMPP